MSNVEFDPHVHGLWLVGGIFVFAGAMLAGNIEFVEGTTTVSFWLAILISIILFLIGGMLWISSAANTKK